MARYENAFLSSVLTFEQLGTPDSPAGDEGPGQGGIMSSPTAQISDDRALSRWAGLPIPLLLLAIALCVMVDPRGVYQPPWLLPTLGFVFSGVISIVVAYLAY